MKKIILMSLVLALSISLVGCGGEKVTKEEKQNVEEKQNEEVNKNASQDSLLENEENTKDEEGSEYVTWPSEDGKEYKFSKTLAGDITKGFSALDSYTWEELGLFGEKDKYIWGPEEKYVGIYIGDESIKTCVIHAQVETVLGMYSVETYYFDPLTENLYRRNPEEAEYTLITKQN